MSKPTRISHPIYNLLPTEIEGLARSSLTAIRCMLRTDRELK